jgi:hypothetical protein
MGKVSMKRYVLEVVEGCSISEHLCSDAPNSQVKKAKKLTRANGRGAVLDGSVLYFWADGDENGELEVGAFDEDLLED